MPSTRSHTRGFISTKVKLFFPCLQDGGSPTNMPPKTVSEYSLPPDHNMRQELSSPSVAEGELFTSTTFTPPRHHISLASGKNHSGISTSTCSHSSGPSIDLSCSGQRQEQRSARNVQHQIKRLLEFKSSASKVTSSIYKAIRTKRHYAQPASVRSQPETQEATEVDELPAYISLKERQSLIYEDQTEQEDLMVSSTYLFIPDNNLSTPFQNFALPTPPSSTYGGRDSPAPSFVSSPLTPPLSPQEDSSPSVQSSIVGSFPFPNYTRPSPSTSRSLSRGRARTRTTNHTKGASSLSNSPPHLTNTPRPQRLRLFPTTSTTDSLPLPAYKRLSLFPDPNTSSLQPLPQLPGRGNSTATISDTASKRKSLPARVSQPPKEEPKTAEEETKRASLREWELASFALKYEDTAVLGQPFHTAKAAELWMGTRGHNGSWTRRRGRL